ncbi:MAG: hypothetical protein Q9181_007732 [Wetmoreana brouardii]
MPSQSPRQLGLALPPMKCNDFIDYVLQSHAAPTTVLVCSSREAFLESLRLSLQTEDPQQQATMTRELNAMPHSLLVPTIHQLATSTTVNIAFAPTLPHLRPYLTSYTPSELSASGSTAPSKPGSRIPMLAIYGLLSLHRITSEHSVQGLSRSVAIAAEAAATWNMLLVLVESPEDPEAATVTEPDSEAGTISLRDMWTEQVPILNSSIALSDDRAWAGRTVDVRAVVGKWCNIIQA